MRAILLCLSLAFLLPAPASARCGGTDLIAALPPDERASLEARAVRAPYPEGLLWRARRRDTRITLFGTYHFAHERTEADLAALEPLIAAADSVWLEVSMADQAQLNRDLARDPSIMFLTDGPTLPDLLGEADWERLKAELDRRAIPGFLAAKFKPVWAAMLLGLGPCEARSGALTSRGIDKAIGALADSLGTSSRSLEDYRTVLTLLDDIPREDQLDMIRLFLAWEGDPDDVAHTLKVNYLAGRIALVWEYSRNLSLEQGGDEAAEDFALFEDLLLTRRNRDWLDRLEEENVSGEIFLAVGAGHLPGRTGLLRMLENRGYEVTRLPFDP